MNNKIIITASGIFGSALMWLVSFKIVAMLLGPSGVAVYSQLRQIIQATGTAATFGGGSSIVQGLSEHTDSHYRQKFRATITIIVFGIGSIVSVAAIAFAPFIAKHMLSSETREATASIQLLSVGIFFNAGAMYLMALLNGYQSLKSLAAAQVTAPLFIVAGLFLTPFISNIDHSIMLSSLFVAGSFFSFILAFAATKRTTKAPKNTSSGFLSKKETLDFVKFSAATLLAALSSSLTMLFVRAQIIAKYGTHQAGLFDASWTLTFNYITLFLTACSILYLPRLSQAKTKQQQMYYLQSTTYIVIACVTLITYIIVIFKSQFLHLLYSPEFHPAEKSLHILAAAVLIRSVSWVLSMLMMATKDSKTLLLSELFFNLLLVAFTFIATQNYTNLEMVALGFLGANLVYFMWIFYCVKQKNSLFDAKPVLMLLFSGVFFILMLFFVGRTKFAQSAPLLQNTAFFCMALIISFISWRAFQKIHDHNKLNTTP